MRITRGWTGLRIAVVALSLGAWLAPDARSAALRTDSISSQMNYSTLGNVDSTGVVGTPIISFDGVKNETFTAPSAFSLGAFQVAGLPGGSSTEYNNTPFHLTLMVNQLDGQTPVPNETPIVVNGFLNGKVTGSGQSSVVATFDTSTLKDFVTGSFKDTLNVFDNPLSLVPSTTNDGRTTAQAQIIVSEVHNPPAIPEPTSISIFLTAIAGYGLRRRFRRSR